MSLIDIFLFSFSFLLLFIKSRISKRVLYSLCSSLFARHFCGTIKISLTKVDAHFRDFFYFWLGFVSRNIYPLLSVEQGHAFGQLPDPRRAPLRRMRARMRARGKNTHVQWYIDLFRLRARSKGIGFTSLFLLYVALPARRLRSAYVVSLLA